jgi:hypothetical protein
VASDLLVTNTTATKEEAGAPQPQPVVKTYTSLLQFAQSLRWLGTQCPCYCRHNHNRFRTNERPHPTRRPQDTTSLRLYTQRAHGSLIGPPVPPQIAIVFVPLALIAYCDDRNMVEALQCWRTITITTNQLDLSEKEYLALMRCAINWHGRSLGHGTRRNGSGRRRFRPWDVEAVMESTCM